MSRNIDKIILTINRNFIIIFTYLCVCKMHPIIFYRAAQSALGCVSRYIKKCVGLEDRKQISDSVSGLQKLTEGLCSETSDLRGSKLIQYIMY